MVLEHRLQRAKDGASIHYKRVRSRGYHEDEMILLDFSVERLGNNSVVCGSGTIEGLEKALTYG